VQCSEHGLLTLHFSSEIAVPINVSKLFFCTGSVVQTGRIWIRSRNPEIFATEAGPLLVGGGWLSVPSSRSIIADGKEAEQD